MLEYMTALELLRMLVEWLSRRTAKDPLLCLAEGHFKVEVANALLDLGCQLQEGTYRDLLRHGQKIKQADYVKIVDGQVIWQRADRRVVSAEGSTDITVVLPIELQLELKTRPDHGTKSQAMFNELIPDIERVSETPHVAFLFGFDQKIYRSFSGAKTHGRGGKSNHSEDLANFFPKSDGMSENILFEASRYWKGKALNLVCMKQVQQSGISRVFVSGIRVDTMSIQNPTEGLSYMAQKLIAVPSTRFEF